MKQSDRSLKFKGISSNRYWWFNNIETNYIPPIFDFLTDEEWQIIDDWYKESDSRSSAAEANVPALSILQGLILGSNIKNIVQLGHYEGFSTLLFGFMQRRMGFKNSIFTIDIDNTVSERTQSWVNRAGLQDYVKVVVSNSSEAFLPAAAREYFKDEINMIFIDSSHQYDHTIEELDLWHNSLKDQGLIVLHDVSKFASQYDSTKSGGVNRAITEWSQSRKVPVFLMNEKVGSINKNYGFGQLTYKDGCGLGLIQKVI
ncbi:MAG TPA: class I SAM-dependent methyltransferase [Puia sp.]